MLPNTKDLTQAGQTDSEPTCRVLQEGSRERLGPSGESSHLQPAAGSISVLQSLSQCLPCRRTCDWHLGSKFQVTDVPSLLPHAADISPGFPADLGSLRLEPLAAVELNVLSFSPQINSFYVNIGISSPHRGRRRQNGTSAKV